MLNPKDLGEGEWWIDDGGDVHFADVDIGAYSHIMVAFEAMLAQYDIFLEDPNIPEMIPMDPLTTEAAGFLRDMNVDKEMMEFLAAHGDPRDWAIEKMGWIRVQSLNFQMWELTSEGLKRLADGLWNAWDMESEDLEYAYAIQERAWIETMKDHKVYAFPVYLLFEKTVTPAKIRKANRR